MHLLKLESPYLLYARARDRRGVWDKPEEAGCKCTFGSFEIDGFETCPACGKVGRPVYAPVPSWHGTCTRSPSKPYNSSTHMNANLSKIKDKISHYHLEKVLAVFPLIFKTFFKIAPKRKNFMSYGFVINKLLLEMGVDTSDMGISMVKTKQKIKENEAYWGLIRSRVYLNI